MNVNPVTTPAPAADARYAARAESQPVSIAVSHLGEDRQRPSLPKSEGGHGQARAIADRDSRANSADRQKADQLKAFVDNANVRLNTYHDEASGRSILEVRDQITGDVVSQYPSEELIRLFASLRQTLVDQSA